MQKSLKKLEITENKIGTLEINDSYRNKIIEQHRKTVDEAQGMMNMLKIKLDDLNDAANSVQALKLDKLEFESRRLKFDRTFKIMKHQQDDMNNRILRLQDFVDKQIPYDYIKSIAEAIDYTSYDNSVRHKLKDFIQPKLSGLKSMFSKDRQWFLRSKTMIEINDQNFKCDPKIFDQYESKTIIGNHKIDLKSICIEEVSQSNVDKSKSSIDCKTLGPIKPINKRSDAEVK